MNSPFFLVLFLALRRARPDPGTPVEVKRTDLVLTVELEGELAAVRSTEIGVPPVAEVDFKIAFLAPEGKEVRAGEPVVGFDTAELERRLAEYRTREARAAQQLEKTRADLELEASNAKLAAAEAESRLGKARLEAESPPDLVAHRDLASAKLRLTEAEREAEFRRRAIEQLAARTEAEASRRERKDFMGGGD